MKELNPIRDAVKLALSAGVAATVASAPMAFAQSDDVAEQDKVTVTGSRIQRVDLETAQPVTTINREDIDASGEISVAEVLRGSTFNSFGSFRQSSGSSAQSQSTVSLRGLGAARTLVLLNGRRMSGSPTFGAGSAANLNIIPIAAVERIEVLRDGASAVYGSDAIGGVVNVILRKDFEGMTLNASMGRPTQEGGDEESYGIVGGVTSGKGNITFALDHAEQDIIFNGDRDFSDVGLSSFGFPGSFFASGPGGESLGTFPDPRCPANSGNNEPTGSGDFPASVVLGGRCRYNYAGVSANEASLTRDSFFINTNYEVTDNISFFAQGIFTKTDSFGRYAPTPQVGGSPFLPTMSAANPNNPTNPANLTDAAGNDLTPFHNLTDANGNVLTGPFDLSIFYRNVPGGFRDSLVENTLLDGLVGLEGSNDWFGGSEWEVGLQNSRQTNKDTSLGLAIRSRLQGAIDDGSYDIFGVNGPTDADVAQTFVHEGFHDEETRITSLDGSLSFDAFQMANGAVPVAVGFEYRDEKFGQNYDGLQNSGSVDGSAGGQDITGARTVLGVFAEGVIPVLDNLDVSIKGRFDSYNDFGTAFTPQVGVAFRPIDSLLLRVNYGEGFRAPSMSQLYSGLAQSFNGAIDVVRCAASIPAAVDADGNIVSGNIPAGTPPNNPCIATQYQNLSGGNPALQAEEADTFSAGVVWNVTDDIFVNLDYFNIELTDGIGTLPLQDILRTEFVNNGSNLVTRNANGTINTIAANNQNLAGIKREGIDLETGWDFSLGNIGDFSTQLNVTYMLLAETDTGAGQGFVEPAGAFQPDWRGALNLTWNRGDLAGTINGNYVDATAFPDGSSSLSSWTTWDLQFAYSTPWNGRVVAGARNVFDRDPPLDAALGNPFYSNGLHDIYGRVPYIRYEQDL
ncbi:MAG: TonB-dependent receptor plug domain-containing protein [Gammaproteobacteria bacterium]